MDLSPRIHCLIFEVQLSNKSHKEKNTTQARANYPQASPGGGSAGAVQEDGGGVPRAGHIGRDILQVASGVWGHGCEPGEAVEASGSGERAPEAPGCGYGIGHPCSEGRSGGKLLSAERKRRRVATVRQRHGCRSAGRVPRLVFGVLFRAIRSAGKRMKRLVFGGQLLSRRTAIAGMVVGAL